MVKLRTILRYYFLTTLVLSSGLAVVRAANDYEENSDDEPMDGAVESGDRSLLLDIPVLPIDTPVALQRFGDDVYKYVGCAAGMYQSVVAYEESLGMDTTANFLGPIQRFEGDRISIQYFDFGNKESGKAMILLPGLGSLMRSWSPILLQGLGVHNRILIMDYPGQGKPPSKTEGLGSFLYNSSSNPLPQYSIDFMANSAYQLLEHLGLNNSNTAVMGRSMGSIVALQMGVLYGDSIGKIIAVSNVVLNTDAKSAYLLENAQSNVDQTKVYYPIDYQEGGCAIAQWLCYKLDGQQVYKNLMSWDANSNTTSYQRIALDQFINNGGIEGFRKIKNPVMGIQGELDNTAPVRNLVYLGNLVSDFYRWVVMRWAGHAVTDEYLTFLTIEIQGFLEDIGDEFEMVGRFPGSWYIENYGGACGDSPCPEKNGPDADAREVPAYVRPSFIKTGTSVKDLENMLSSE